MFSLPYKIILRRFNVVNSSSPNNHHHLKCLVRHSRSSIEQPKGSSSPLRNGNEFTNGTSSGSNIIRPSGLIRPIVFACGVNV